MQAIFTKYLGATTHRSSRIKVTASGRYGSTTPWNHALSVEDNHHAAAQAFARKLGWDGTWTCGGNLKGTGNVYVRSGGHCFLVTDERTAP